MSKVIVRGSAPGMMRVEVEGTELHVDISTALPAYTAVQELAAFMEVLLQVVPFEQAAKPFTKPSKAPPKGDA